MTEQTMRGACYTCKHRGTVPGSAHSSCQHPLARGLLCDSMGQILAILGSVGRVDPILGPSGALKVEGDPYGIESGWFIWPWNFDPTWLKKCEGYAKKEES